MIESHYEPDRTYPDRTPADLIADATFVAQPWVPGEDVMLQLEPREAEWLDLDGVGYPVPGRLGPLAQQMARHVDARTTLVVRMDGHEPHVVDLAWLEGRDYRHEQSSLMRRLARVPTLLRRLGAQGAFSVHRVATTTAEKRALHDAVLAGQGDGLWFRPRTHAPGIVGPVFLRRATHRVRVDRRDPDHTHAVFVEYPSAGGQWRRLGSVVVPLPATLPPSCTWVQVSTCGAFLRFLQPRYEGPCAAPSSAAQLPLTASRGEADHG